MIVCKPNLNNNFNGCYKSSYPLHVSVNGQGLRIAVLLSVIIFLSGFACRAAAQSYASAYSSVHTMVDQANGDSVDISQMVQSQIDAARKKEMQEKDMALKQAVVKLKEIPDENPDYFFVGLRRMIPLSDDALIKLFVLASASAGIFIFVFIKRSSLRKKSGSSKLKNNIKLLREEKISSVKNGKLTEVRNRLTSAPSTYETSNRAVARNARDMQIAKGEIYLAAKIKSHEISRASGRKH